jgi:hypothetical protein
MKTVKALAILLLLSVGATAAPKHKTQYDVCYVKVGALACVGAVDKSAKALAVAEFLNASKANGGVKHFVVVEAVKGDVK